MKILRTDGGGSSKNDKRLLILKDVIEFFNIKGVEELHDHKGNLKVTWAVKPSGGDKEIIKDFWNAFNEYEIEHVLIRQSSIEEIYNNLYTDLLKYYGESGIKLKDGTIYVDCSTSLFNWMSYEFYGIQLDEMPISNIVKIFSDQFYCEFENTTTVIISYLK